MGLLGLMPGEWDAQGGGGGLLGGGMGGKLNAAMDNPLFQMGVGILANNSGHYGAFGPAVGGGLAQGMQNMRKQKEDAMRKQMYDLEMQKVQREVEQQNKEREALADFDNKFPEYKGLASIDPKAALKIAYPGIASGSVDPYYTVVPTENGLGRFNARTGEFELISGPDGKPFVNSKDSPLVRGAVKGAEAQAGAAWKPNTDIDGQVLTDAQVAQMAYGNNPIPFTGQQQAPQLPTSNFSTPYPVTFGAPGTTATDRAEGVTSDASIQIRNPARPNAGGGIKVPTAAELSAQKKAAEAEAEFNSPEAIEKRGKAKEFKQTMGKVVIDKIDDVTKRVDGWTAGLGGRAMDGVPGTDAYDLKADLETIKANFGFDRLQAMRDMSPTGGALGQVAVQELSALQASVANLDNAQSPAQLKANLKKAKTHYENWLDTIEGKSPSKPADASNKPTAAKPARAPMKGQVVDGYKFMGGNPADPNNWKRK